MRAQVITDSITTGGLRLTTIAVSFPNGLFEHIVRPRELCYSAPLEPEFKATRLPSAERRLLLTSSKWGTTTDCWFNSKLETVRQFGLAVSTALRDSKPTKLCQAEWHLPYLAETDIDAALEIVVQDAPTLAFNMTELHDRALNILIQVSIARCMTMGCVFDATQVEVVNRDLTFFSNQSELSATTIQEFTEHLATPDYSTDDRWLNPNLHGKLTGFCQYTQIYTHEAWRLRATS